MQSRNYQAPKHPICFSPAQAYIINKLETQRLTQGCSEVLSEAQLGGGWGGGAWGGREGKSTPMYI